MKMRKYAAYISSLDELLQSTAWGRVSPAEEILHPQLNGGASTALRKLVSRDTLRESGAFFTEEMLGRRMIEFIPASEAFDKPAWDPSCGAGDLLLRWSERLPLIEDDLRATLAHWSEKLQGADIHPEFLKVAKRRIALAAISRGAKLRRGSIKNLDSYFHRLECRDMLDREIRIPNPAVVLMNPPFTMIQSQPKESNWSSGRVAFAAVAFLNCLKAAEPGQKLLAILPDVLRSGSRYERWRNLVSQLSSNTQIEIVGRFSKTADVDVFIISTTARSESQTGIEWIPRTNSSRLTLGDICDVRVGSVVPYRHKHEGPRVPYLTTSDAPPWEELKSLNPSIRHKGSCVSGPFLAIRRTSSPSDNSRAIATLINIRKPIAIENHIITLRPKDGTLKQCKFLQGYLQSTNARGWLDHRIRCRHLTVSALKQLPLPYHI